MFSGVILASGLSKYKILPLLAINQFGPFHHWVFIEDHFICYLVISIAIIKGLSNTQKPKTAILFHGQIIHLSSQWRIQDH